MGKNLVALGLLITFSVVAFSQNNVAPVADEGTDAGLVYKIVEEMPEYPGGQEALLKYIATIGYPQIARENDWEGTVYIQFVIGNDGSVQDVAVASSSGHFLLDSISIAHLSRMANWKPGKQQGKNVRVQYVVPIKFKLGDDEPSVYRVVDTEPTWGAGPQALEGYLAYCPVPGTVSKKEAKGKEVTVEAVINPDGSVSGVKVLTSSGNAELDKYAVAHVRVMPNWNPGEHKGKKVAVYRIFKVSFQK